ncbi:isoaspartyl peptidase/L-asparaginase [Natrialbaceae archaeon AArc-T1-2]|uniref:isoaspartyl peptidase/L-asparaginase n=1 Tax=Natrialbaceae archaeon AArc-T1-2 TaxID=3053904 RepID=UPI00255B3705|nr:isoaspartyl peptidase/L-asparaginase [Natrialbaceae archaeon AArc-T1-2]WIV68138.1 isoaspartyl peptidase/L-asparaginase [Natrialbaceae archaeon AArc-T1-2]
MHVIVHGGACSDTDEPAARQRTLEEAAETGADAATPLDAVEAAVNVLEAAPLFNAGVGSVPQSDGEIRTDAGIMTDDRSVGAVCSMPGVERAVSVARVVLAETPHILLSGEHAVSLADACGIDTGVDLWTDRTRELWDDLDAPAAGPTRQLEWVRGTFDETDSDGSTSDPADHDTVGAVAFDGDAFAAATSTGGRLGALAGRVGDVPQVGSGYYCSSAGAAGATGAGEDIARTMLSRRVVRHLEDGRDAQSATDRAIEEFEELTGSAAGVIAIDDRGTIGSAYNSDSMATASVRR